MIFLGLEGFMITQLSNLKKPPPNLISPLIPVPASSFSTPKCSHLPVNNKHIYPIFKHIEHSPFHVQCSAFQDTYTV